MSADLQKSEKDSSEQNDRMALLASKWLEGNLTQEEEIEFNTWYNSSHEDAIDIEEDHSLYEDQLKEKLFKSIEDQTGIQKINQNAPGRLSQKLKANFQKGNNVQLLFSRRVAVLLFIIAVISVIGHYSKKEVPEQIVALANSTRKVDMLPGTEKAILTLANGRKLLLDSTVNGLLAMQGNLSVTATMNSGLLYEQVNSKRDNSDAEEWQTEDEHTTYNAGSTDVMGNNPSVNALEVQNTLSTPRGALYHVTLSDGTKVWINAASSITFPVRFKGKDRHVKIKGEAYFEVAKNAAKPFKVTVDEMEVTVLGTHFNINAYRDESSLNTTLLEGSVSVLDLHNGLSKKIQPGHEARMYATDEIKVTPVNTALATAWKNGMFQFDKTDLRTLLNEVARWYNINVEWRGTGSPDRFTGTIPRTLKLSELLSVLDYANVRFRLENNKLTVYT